MDPTFRLPTPEEDPSYHNITAAIGRCIACWARVEDELANLFTHMTRTYEDFPEHIASRRIFYAVRSFEARLDLVEAAMKGPPSLSVELQSDWPPLINLLRRKGSKRNEVAHCATLQFTESFEGDSHFADPYCNYTGKLNQDRSKLISIKHLQDRAQGFVELALRVARFQDRIASHLGRQQTSALLFANPHLRVGNQTIPTPEAPPEPRGSSDFG